MGRARIVYQNWVVDECRDQTPRQWENVSGNGLDEPGGVGFQDNSPDGSTARTARIKREVGRAMERLSIEEREFVVLFYYIGLTFREIAEKSGRSMHKIEALQRRAVKRLKKELGSFVVSEFGLQRNSPATCVICNSPHRAEIDRLMLRRDRRATWRPFMRVLRDEFGITVTRPTQLVGHEKYH
jgi:hypothetical protein